MPATTLDIIIKARDEASAAIGGVADKIQKHSRAMGVAMTAVGAASLKLIGDAKKLNAQIGVTAMGLGVTTGELRKLVLATSNVTFPLSEVTASFDLLTRAGMENAEEMAATATVFDTLGDAIGMSASQVTSIMVPALKAYGIDLKDAGEHVDSFTWLVRNTTVNLSEFSAALTYLAPDMDKLGISIDETVGVLAALEKRGISGSAATRELRRAVTEAIKEQKSLNEVLGISDEELATYMTELESATGITQEYADEANKQYGLIDRLKHGWSELQLRIGSFLEPLEDVMGAMAALGPVMIVLSTSAGKATFAMIAHTIALVAHKIAAWASFAATVALTAATTAFGVALKIALGPIGWVVLAIGGLVAAGTALWQNWEMVKEKCLEIFGAIKDFFLDTFDAIRDFLVDTWDNITSGVINKWNSIKDFFWGILRSIKGLFTDTWATIKDATKTAFEKVAYYMLWPINKAVNAITGALNIAVDALNVLVSGINLIPGVSIPSIPHIPHWEMPALEFAKGGVVTKPTLALVGEAGPEAIIPLDARGFDLGGDKIRNMIADAISSWTHMLAVSAEPEAIIPPGRGRGGIVNKPTIALVGEKGPKAIIPLDQGRGRGGVVHLHTHIYLDGEQIAETVTENISEQIAMQAVSP